MLHLILIVINFNILCKCSRPAMCPYCLFWLSIFFIEICDIVQKICSYLFCFFYCCSRFRRSLQDHCLTHHDSKPNHRFVCPCDSCDYRTHNKSLLKVHLASHSIESFKCPEKDCDYVGKSEFHLKR